MSEILIVDDDPDVLSIVHDMLELAGLAAMTATNIADAKQLLLDGRRVRLAIMDLLIPPDHGLDGLGLAKFARDRGVKVLVITGAIDRDERLEAARFFFIRKPFSSEDLISAVRMMLPQPS
jgi:DNA-binding NtrC family response regulator